MIKGMNFFSKNINRIITIQRIVNIKNFNLNSLMKQNFSYNSNTSTNINFLQTPEELYVTPIYDIENPDFSETYLNFLFNTKTKELNNKYYKNDLITENIVNFIYIYVFFTSQNAICTMNYFVKKCIFFL